MSETDAGIKTQVQNEYDSICGLCPINWAKCLLRFDGSHEEKVKKLLEILATEHALMTK